MGIIEVRVGTQKGANAGEAAQRSARRRIDIDVTNTQELLAQLIQQRHRIHDSIAAALDEIDHLDKLIADLGEADQLTEKRLRKATMPARLNVAQVARYLGVGRHTVYDLLAAHELPTHQFNGLTVVLKEDIDVWLRGLPEDSRFRTQASKKIAS